MNNLILLFLSIAPGVLLLIYFYQQDRYQKEPKAAMLRLFLLSALITIPLAILFGSIFEIFALVGGIIGIFISAFCSAALVEETLKYFMVKWFVFQKPYFDEVIDGIVYAVTASLGFATLENIMYVMFDENPYSVGIVRAITAVPSHAFDGAVLGYFLGLAKFAKNADQQKVFIKKGLTYAILFHGFYDFFLFTGFLFFLVIPLLIFQFFMVKRALWQALQKNPPEVLYQNMVAGLTLGDFVKLFFGTIFSFATLFGYLILIFGIVMPESEDTVLTWDVGLIIFIFFSFWAIPGFLLFRNVWKRKRRYNREVLKEDRMQTFFPNKIKNAGL